jgi:hypothetical protein
MDDALLGKLADNLSASAPNPEIHRAILNNWISTPPLTATGADIPRDQREFILSLTDQVLTRLEQDLGPIITIDAMTTPVSSAMIIHRRREGSTISAGTCMESSWMATSFEAKIRPLNQPLPIEAMVGVNSALRTASMQALAAIISREICDDFLNALVSQAPRVAPQVPSISDAVANYVAIKMIAPTAIITRFDADLALLAQSSSTVAVAHPTPASSMSVIGFVNDIPVYGILTETDLQPGEVVLIDRSSTILAPYVLITPSMATVDQTTFQLNVPLRARYGSTIQQSVRYVCGAAETGDNPEHSG